MSSSIHVDYVAGFLLSPNATQVALIEKKKGPAAIVSKLNAIGGKIEAMESPEAAMRREFSEETGVDISAWRRFVVLKHSAWNVHFFVARSTLLYNVRTTESEKVSIYFVADIGKLNVVPNVRWILPMALSLHLGESADSFTVLENHL